MGEWLHVIIRNWLDRICYDRHPIPIANRPNRYSAMNLVTHEHIQP
jgi:hypothetical protein